MRVTWKYYNNTLFCRRLLIRFSSSCGVEEDKGTASAVPDTNDSTGSVWVGAHGKHVVGESEHSSNDLFESFLTGFA
jgi:hypothetical protein